MFLADEFPYLEGNHFITPNFSADGTTHFPFLPLFATSRTWLGIRDDDDDDDDTRNALNTGLYIYHHPLLVNEIQDSEPESSLPNGLL